MSSLKVYKRNSNFVDLSDLVADISSLGLGSALEKYYDTHLEKKPKV